MKIRKIISVCLVVLFLIIPFAVFAEEVQTSSGIKAVTDFPDVLRIVEERKAPITLSNPYKLGFVFIQDKASCAVAHILDAKPQDFVIDLCAAPGMKTTHIAQTMKNKGFVLATDINSYRAKMIKINTKRSGIKNVEILCTDGKILKLKPEKKADKILVDAPCSGSGTFQTHPEEKWRLTPSKIEKYALLQENLLSSRFS